MRNPTITEQVKHNLRQQLSQAFKQLKGKCSDNDWKEFESFFWKIRPHLEIDYEEFEPKNNKSIVRV
jgi:hypothetical protein